jgi:transcriptional regulator with XRE-family HTH domain
LNFGLTQQALAEKAGVSYKYYQDLEAGRLAGLTLATVERLSGALGVEAWKLFHPGAIPESIRAKAWSSRMQR